MVEVNNRAKRKIAYFFANAGVIAITVVWLIPIIWMFLNSFRPGSEPFYSGILPSKYTIENYIKALTDKSVLRAFSNSILVCGAAAGLDVILGCLAAYGLSRYKMRGKDFLQVTLLVIRLFPGVILVITLFKIAGYLGVYDTFLPLILVNALVNLPFGIMNLRATFDALPIELEEASWLDGLTRVGGIVRILFPVMAPSIVATGAFIFLLCWNEYLFAVSFTRSIENQLMTVSIATNIGQYHIDFVGLITHGMIASLPLLLVFMWMQRYIVSGLTAGSVRG